MSLSKRDVSVFKQLLHTLPPNVEFIIIEKPKNREYDIVLANTIPDFKGRTTLNKRELFQYMNDTSEDYFYQLTSPPIEKKDTNIVFISRTSREIQHRKNDFFAKSLRIALFFTAFFEVFCILLVASLSITITRSITLLNKNTQRIANGEFDVKLDYEKNTKTDNEITSLTESLDKMRLALKDNAERRCKFIMGISHDLRTPVAVIKGYTEAISEGFCTTPEETKKSLKIISAKTEQLETMINTLINFVKLNQTDWMQQLKKQKIAPVLEEFAQSSVTTGGLFKRNVSKNIQIDENIEVPFDSELIQRALENLFSNALRYTNENDAIEIIAYQEKLDGNNERILVKIKDYGIGIKKEDLEKIFDMFYRSSSSRREEGMGIGLATVMTIVKAHGWKISVDSELNKGSEFIIEIPVK